MGILFFGLTVFGFVRRKAGHVVARSQYPALAQKLGLAYTASPFKSGVGRLDGEVDGFRITVDPDDQRRIYLRFSSAPAIELQSYAHNKRPAPGQRSFRPTSSVLGQLFKTSHGSTEMIERLEADEEISGVLKPLKFVRSLKTLSVTSSGVTAVFDYGNPPFIPADVVQDTVPRLIRLAQTFEDPSPGHTGT